jgi:CRP/FNR family transcriptional regulator, cyclic AMP receptor protein
MIDDKLLLIRNYNLWSHLTDEEYDELNVVHNFIEARKGDYIYFDSHLLNKLYFIKEGFIKIGYVDEKGEEIVKEIIQKGEIFGQFSLQKNNLNGEFARAHKSDVSLCAFNVEDFEKLLSKKPQLAIPYSKQIGQKLRNAENRLVNLLHKDVRSRLLGFFFNLAQQNGYDGSSPSFAIENFLTHDDIARLIGSSRQTVTGFINELENEGLLQFSRRQIYIPDVKKLQISYGVI